MPVSPALHLHEQAGAEIEEVHGWRLATAYSSVAEEYDALRQAAGLVDRSHWGRLRVEGKDALDLMDRLSTNKLVDLEVGQGLPSVLTSNKGRILDLLFVLRQSDHLLVMTSPENRQKVADWIDFYTFVEDVTVRDVTEETAMLAVTGPKAAELLQSLGVGRPDLYHASPASIGGTDALVVRTDFVGLPGYEMVAPDEHGSQLWDEIRDAGSLSGVKPAGLDALEAVRIERGIPVYGKELSEEVNPLEATLKEYVSFNKGCYIGQEVVARLNTYDKVQRRLVGLSWGFPDSLPNQAVIKAAGKTVGKTTSAAVSPGSGKGIGLAYVVNSALDSGSELTIDVGDGEPLPVRVRELPVSP